MHFDFETVRPSPLWLFFLHSAKNIWRACPCCSWGCKISRRLAERSFEASPAPDNICLGLAYEHWVFGPYSLRAQTFNSQTMAPATRCPAF